MIECDYFRKLIGREKFAKVSDDYYLLDEIYRQYQIDIIVDPHNPYVDKFQGKFKVNSNLIRKFG